MGLFDKLRSSLRPAAKTQGKLPNALLVGEVGEAGTSNASGYITEDFNPMFNGTTAPDTFDQMRKTDATVHATLKAIELPIMAARRSIVPADEEDPKQVEIAEFVAHNLFENLRGGFDDFLREALGYKTFGFYYFEKVFEVKDGKVMIKKLAARQPNAHLRWTMSTHPEIPGITQQLPTLTPEAARRGQMNTNPEIPFSKLVLFTNDREGDNFEGVSVLRSAYIHWYFKNTLYRLDGIKHERGAGILRIKLPENSSEDDKTAAAELAKNFKINEASFLILPNPEWEAELMTTGIADQSSALMDSVKHHDREITKNILAQFIDLGGGETGSFALSKDQSAFFLLSLEETARYMAEIINNQLIKELVDLNFGPQEAYPKLVFSKIGSTDAKAMADVLEKLVNTGMLELTPTLRVWIHDTFDLPELSPEDAEAAEEERLEKEEADRDTEMKRIEARKDVDEEENEEPEKELAEGKKKRFKPFRPLTLAEERVKFAEFRDFFNGAENKIKAMLANLSIAQRDKMVNQVNKAIQSGNVNAIRKTSLLAVAAIARELKDAAKEAFENGKRKAANEIGVSVPETPSVDVRVRNARIEQAIDDRAQDIEKNMRNKGLDLARKGVGAAAAAFALRKAFDKASDIHNQQLVGRSVATNVNAGRSLTFDKNQDQISALQRSEILDERTCAMCLSIDGRVIEKDDPFAKIDQVHTNCRGIWVAIKTTDPTLPTPKPIPQSIANRFDTVDGVPTANNFKQLKKPIIGKTSRVAENARSGELVNPNLNK